MHSGTAFHYQFENPSAAQHAAHLIGIPFEELTNIVFATDADFDSASSCNLEQSVTNLESLICGMYNEVVTIVVALINNSICTRSHSINSILLVDSAGIQNLSRCGSNLGASLDDLTYNYLQERLHYLFCHNSLIAPRIRYAQELVEIDQEGFRDSQQGPLIALLDKIPQNQRSFTSKVANKTHADVGLFWLLDEETMQSNTSDVTFLERVFNSFGNRDYQSILSPGNTKNEFILHHLQGTNPVLYCVNGWLNLNKSQNLKALTLNVIQKSKKIEIQKLFSINGLTFNRSTASTLRKCSSIRQAIASCGNNNKSNIVQVMKLIIYNTYKYKNI